MTLFKNIILFLKNIWHALTLTNSNRHREKGLKRYFTENTYLNELDKRQRGHKRNTYEQKTYEQKTYKRNSY